MGTKSSIHGGSRPGAGRPSLADGTGRRVNVYMDTDSIATAVEAGAGNMSKGIRSALEFWRISNLKKLEK